ncbi:unnamed protein product [Cylindrotheca closterium]|uniref:Uncharacterized protein n=1 Tax=Cylindrotheca closterium TaxID=2856 RepID=A0AAD2PXF8_9STRA|nr:unnamed protein product [Cylindrotheca closterium]
MFHPRKVNRVQRAQSLKQRRGANSSSADEGSGGLDLEVGPFCTLLCALLIVALGAAMAIAFFAVQKPDCMKNFGLDRASLLRGAFSSSSSKSE